jgi:hypothetical protein
VETPEFGLDGLPLDADPHDATGFAPSPVPTPAAVDDSEPVPFQASSPAPRIVPAASGSLVELDEALSHAGDRDAIADVLLGFAAGRARRAALFSVGKDGVKGIAGRGRAFDNDRLRKLSLPVRSGTVFDTALGSRDFYFGVVPALPPNRDLYTALGGRLPASVLILPVVLKERTVALLYLDDDDERMLNPDISTMRRVALKAGLAFEILLLRNKLRDLEKHGGRPLGRPPCSRPMGSRLD